MPPSGHIVVCGSDGLAVRVVEGLLALGETVVCVIPADDRELAARFAALDAPVVLHDADVESVLRAAAVPECSAVSILHQDDVGNVSIALAAQELQPGVRLVLRIFEPALGERLPDLFTDCATLSAAALAAPSFAHAALHGNASVPVDVHGHVLALREVERDDPRCVVPLAAPDAGSTPDLFPGEGAGRVLGLVELAAMPEDAPPRRIPRFSRKERLAARGRGLVRVVNRRLAAFVLVLAVLVLAGTFVFHLARGNDWGDSAFLTFTTISSGPDLGFLSNDGAGIKVLAVLLTLAGALLLGAVIALLTDALVSARLARTLGDQPLPRSDHVVVCGLGNIGFRVVQALTAEDVPCVAVERRADGPFADAARRLGVPVITGDASRGQTLQPLCLGDARALMALTDDDLANLEVALGARARHPGLRIVMRLFDTDLAERAGRALQIRISRSVSALAAPRFVAALLRRKILATIPVGSRALVVVEAAAPAGYATVGALERGFEVRVLEASGEWRPPRDTELAHGAALVLITTREGLGALADAGAA